VDHPFHRSASKPAEVSVRTGEQILLASHPVVGAGGPDSTRTPSRVRPPVGEDVRVRIETVAFDHPDAARLVTDGQADEIARYGEGDMTPIDPSEFAPPRGLFLVGYLGDEPVGCGGWRAYGEDAELKRMYVATVARRRGVARAILAAIERSAGAAGHRRIVLETGHRQPEAIAFYRSAGYVDVPGYGYYADDPETVPLGKDLTITPSTAAP
jgi:GNAT superfamily N-acetyltransferase